MLAFNESTSIICTPQLIRQILMPVQHINAKIDMTRELASVKSLHETTADEGITM